MDNILVKDIYTEFIQNEIRICCDFKINNEIKTLWYSTAIKNKKFLSLDNCDAFFVILTLLAFKENKNIHFTFPVSARIYDGFIDYIKPTLLLINKKFSNIDIKIDSFNYNNYNEANSTVTAMSLGVDSFYTLKEMEEYGREIKYFTLFNAGAFGGDGGIEARELYNKFKEEVRVVSERMNIELIEVDTNLNEILKMDFIHTHTFRNLSCVLLFQKLIKTYYYSAAYHLKDIKVSNKSTAGSFDLVYTAGLSANNLIFKSIGLFNDRFQKTIYISNYPITYDSLNVCMVIPYNKLRNNLSIKNCSKCSKCVRTMITLDIIGKLEDYKSVFDVALYYNNKDKYLGELLYRKYRMKEIYAKEIFNEIKKHKIKLSTQIYYYAFLRVLQTISKKIFKYA